MRQGSGHGTRLITNFTKKDPDRVNAIFYPQTGTRVDASPCHALTVDFRLLFLPRPP